MLNNLEKLENVLFSGGYFSVKNVVTLGAKSATGNRLDPIYSRSYNSTKYNDRSTLEIVKFSYNKFITFAYNDFDNKINEEIFISYPHMPSLISFIDECYNLVNTPGVFTNNGVSAKYNDCAVESESFIGGKKMIAIPAVWDGKELGSIKKGLLLFLSSEDVCVQLDVNSVISLQYIISTFNLSVESNQLVMMGMLNDGLQGKAAAGFGGSVTTGTTTTTTRTGITKRGLFSNGGAGKRQGLGAGYVRTNANKTVNNNIANQDVPEEVIEESTFGDVQEEVSNAPVITNGKISMKAILDTADQIEVEDINEVEI